MESSYDPNAIVLGGALEAPQGGGCTNISAIVNARTYRTTGNLGPIYHFNSNNNTIADYWTGDYFLNSSLYIQDNVRLDIFGPDYGGDVNNFYVRSDKDKFITIRAHGGRLRFKGVNVQSLDRSEDQGRGGPDTNIADGRSFVTAISEVVLDPDSLCDGRAQNTKGEARLDIHDCTFAYLGYYNAESYGISYKVRGLCSNHENLDIMENVAVYGDITDSEIHNQFFGHYSFGHKGGNWSGNHVHDNVGYGFDPHDDSDNAVIANNHVHDNGWHGIIASKRCNNLTIAGNLVHDNGRNGIMLHRSCDDSTIANNEAYQNGDAGAAIFETSNTTIYGNNFHDNRFGIRLSLGSSNNDIYDNTFDTTEATAPVGTNSTATYAVFMYQGSDTPEVAGSDGKPGYNRFFGNKILGKTETMKIIDTRNSTFEENVFAGDFVRFRNSTSISWTDNELPQNYEVKFEGTTCFEGDDSLQSEGIAAAPMC